MDSIRGTPEAVENEFGESIVNRDEAMLILSQVPGLGPPDLIWLQKANKGPFGGASTEARGYYHYALGRDVSSSAQVAAYFAGLNSSVEPIPFLQVGVVRGGGLWSPPFEWGVARPLVVPTNPRSKGDLNGPPACRQGGREGRGGVAG